MAIYHCSIKIISRSDGKSAVASSAYRSGEKLMDDRTGLVHDFTKKRGVVFTEVALPAHAPPEYIMECGGKGRKEIQCTACKRNRSGTSKGAFKEMSD